MICAAVTVGAVGALLLGVARAFIRLVTEWQRRQAASHVAYLKDRNWTVSCFVAMVQASPSAV
jgi:hypothetical protein